MLGWRPSPPPVGRVMSLAILELRAARGWSLERTARVFQVSTAALAKGLALCGPANACQRPTGPCHRHGSRLTCRSSSPASRHSQTRGLKFFQKIGTDSTLPVRAACGYHGLLPIFLANIAKQERTKKSLDQRTGEKFKCPGVLVPPVCAILVQE
jgi:hypothetical protein